MPIIIRKLGFEIRIYSDDHAPAHVHCLKAGTELVVNLDALAIRENNGMSRGDRNQALSIIAANQPLLLAEWNRIHPCH